MKIKEDMSHVNQSLIDSGLMKIVPYSIRLEHIAHQRIYGSY